MSPDDTDTIAAAAKRVERKRAARILARGWLWFSPAQEVPEAVVSDDPDSARVEDNGDVTLAVRIRVQAADIDKWLDWQRRHP